MTYCHDIDLLVACLYIDLLPLYRHWEYVLCPIDSILSLAIYNFPFIACSSGHLHLFAVAGVYFDPDMYVVKEGGNVTLILKTNVTVIKSFDVLVNSSDNSAKGRYSVLI